MLRTHLHNLRRPAQKNRPCGTTVVEMAIVLPVFFMLIFAAVEFFRLSMLRQYAENVSYEAARTVIVPGGSATEATAVANDMLNKLGIKNAVVTVTPPTIADSTGNVTVKVTIPTSENQWLSPFFTSSSKAAAETQLLTERVPSIAVKSVPPPPPPPPPPSPPK
ncbi:MAG: TadE/TadG family type IV pilus assembly protein, partial [Planctomyces sp.]